MPKRSTKVKMQGGKELRRSQLRAAKAERRKSGGDVTLGTRLVPKQRKRGPGKAGAADRAKMDRKNK